MKWQSSNAPPEHSRSVLLLMTNSVFEYHAVGQFDQHSSIWRLLSFDGYGVTAILNLGVEVLRWKEIE